MSADLLEYSDSRQTLHWTLKSLSNFSTFRVENMNLSHPLCQSSTQYISMNTFPSSLKLFPLSCLFLASPLLSITVSLLSYSIIFVLAYPHPVLSFLYFFSLFFALTGNGFACHVTLVTDCVMDGILVRALLCLRHTAGQRHLATSHSTCHAPHPAHVTLHYLDFHSCRFSFSKQPCFGFPPICWHFTLVWHYLSLLLCICVLQTVHHCFILCILILGAVPLFFHQVIYCNNTVSSNKRVNVCGI